MGFYRVYKTKAQAQEAAKELRTPSGSTKHRYGYPANITVQKESRGWAVYIYKR